MAESQRTIEQIVSDALAASGAPDPRALAGMSQGELLMGALGRGLMLGPLGLAPAGMRPVPGPSTAGVQMPPEAAGLPPAWRTTRQGYGATPEVEPPANTNAPALANGPGRMPLGPPRQPLSGEQVMLYQRLLSQGIPEGEAMRWARNWRFFGE